MDLNLTDYYFTIAALIFVIALIGIAGTIARRLGFGIAAKAQKGAKRRLALIETKSLDAKRRLVLLKCDDKEYLMLLGAESDLLIEASIKTQTADMEAPDIAFAQAAGPQAAGQRGNLTLAAIGGESLAAK